MCKRPTTHPSPICNPIDNIDMDQFRIFLRRLVLTVRLSIETDRATVSGMAREVEEVALELQDLWQDLMPQDVNFARQQLQNMQAAVDNASRQLQQAEIFHANLVLWLQHLERLQQTCETILKH